MLKHTPPTATPFEPAAIRRVWRDERPLASFVHHLKKYLGANHLFLGASGRTVLYVLLKTLQAEFPARYKVVLPAYTCPALGKVVLDVGLEPYFVDISPNTFQFDLEQLQTALHERSLAVICVHPFGLALDFGEVIDLAHAQGVFAIEDAAQAMGARWQGQRVGTRGDFGIFSLGPGKPLSTGGGGVLVSQSARYADRLAEQWHSLAKAGSAAAVLRYLLMMAAFHPYGWWWATRLGSRRFGASNLGQAYRLAQLSAGQAKIGAAHLPLLDGWNETRRKNAALWQDSWQNEAWSFLRFPAADPNAEPIFLRLPILADTPLQREEIFEQLWQKNIGVGRMYQQTLPELFPYCTAAAHPGARKLADCLLTLPTNYYVKLPTA